MNNLNPWSQNILIYIWLENDSTFLVLTEANEVVQLFVFCFSYHFSFETLGLPQHNLLYNPPVMSSYLPLWICACHMSSLVLLHKVLLTNSDHP